MANNIVSISAITFTEIPAHGNWLYKMGEMTRAEFGVGFGQALASLPLHHKFTATQIRDEIAPDFTTQKITAYLKKACLLGIVKRTEEVKNVWVDPRGKSHIQHQAFYERI